MIWDFLAWLFPWLNPVLFRPIPAYSELVQGPPQEGRSSHWPAVRRAHLLHEPECQVCGTRDNLDVHHVEPFHLEPAKELLESNLITLCRPDHLIFGHLHSWRAINKHCRHDCQVWRVKILNRDKAWAA